MPMGATCAAEIFQREMLNAFSDLDGVEIVVDDILVHAKDHAEHRRRLRSVLERARHLNLKLSHQKSRFGLHEVDYVGHRLTKDGLKPTDERIRDIKAAGRPTNFKELDTLLGMFAYVAKFIPRLSEINAPLRDLSRKEIWSWEEEHQQSLDKIIKILTSDPVLRFYDVSQPVTLTVDASLRGLGAAIIQGNGVVAYASRALTPTEQNYAQIEKEALAVVFGCSKFHKLIYGKHDVTIESDHQPLETIIQKPLHKAPPRVQRMLLKLQPYTFKLIHVKGKDIGLADFLSRFPQQDSPPDHALDDELMICKVDTLLGGHHQEYAEATYADPVAQKLKQVIFRGWPNKQDLDPELKPFWEHRDELSTCNGIITRGQRIYIPVNKRKHVLHNLHRSHLGITRTKQLARDTVYWPSMNSDIEEYISRCETCLQHRNNQPKEPMIPHQLPMTPWSKVGTDLFEFQGKSYLILVDYYSNFIEVEELKTQTSREVMLHMKRIIARNGIMDTLISDNGPCYNSKEFADFANQYNFNHITSSPYRPQSNGLAERSVQTIKRLMTKCTDTNEDFHLALLQLRNTPRDDIGSPAQRLYGRRTQTTLPLTDAQRQPHIIPTETVTNSLAHMKETQKHYYDRTTKPLAPLNTQPAIRMNTKQGWLPAEHLSNHNTPRSHLVRSGLGQTYRRNRDQIMTTREPPHTIQIRPEHAPPPLPPPRHNPTPNIAPPTPTASPTPNTTNTPTPAAPITPRPQRTRQPPVWMQDYVSK
jgi:transposase InsO family protein